MTQTMIMKYNTNILETYYTVHFSKLCTFILSFVILN